MGRRPKASPPFVSAELPSRKRLACDTTGHGVRFRRDELCVSDAAITLVCAQMTWNARSVPSGGCNGGCNGGGAAPRGMHRAYLFRQGHEQARGGCIDATTTLVCLITFPLHSS